MNIYPPLIGRVFLFLSFLPNFLTPGQISIGQSKVYFCGVDGETYELTAKSGAWFPVYGDSFTYTGDYQIIDDGGGNWRVRFLTSGTFTAVSDLLIDVFAVGGGGGGGGGKSTVTTAQTGGGGGGGYTKTSKSIVLTANTEYEIIVGVGGNGGSIGNNGTSGGSSSAFGNSVDGGFPGALSGGGTTGGDGGSGGGHGAFPTGNLSPSDGGSDGSTPISKPSQSVFSGAGQGTTTREFGEPTGDLYAGGGGGAGGVANSNTVYGGSGGEGGGGDGAYKSSSDDLARNGIENTGGGGGAGGKTSYNGTGGSGGSGIVIIRNHRE